MNGDGNPKNPELSAPIARELVSNWDPVMVNVSGKEDEPLWVQACEIAAVGKYGEHNSLVVLCSGTQLTAKSIHPNEVAQLVCGVPPSTEQDDPRWLRG